MQQRDEPHTINIDYSEKSRTLLDITIWRNWLRRLEFGGNHLNWMDASVIFVNVHPAILYSLSLFPGVVHSCVSHHASVQSFYLLMSLQLVCYPYSFILALNSIHLKSICRNLSFYNISDDVEVYSISSASCLLDYIICWWERHRYLGDAAPL